MHSVCGAGQNASKIAEGAGLWHWDALQHGL